MRRSNFYRILSKILITQFFVLLLFNGFSAHQKTFSFYRDLTDTTGVNQPSFNKKRFWLVTGGHLAAYGGSLAALSQVWYDDFDRSKLHAFNDMDEWGGMDKLGHVVTAWQLANFSYSLYRYTGMSNKKAAFIGSSVSLLYQTTLEFFDGYSSKWGFSFGDMGANIVGAGLSFFRNTYKLQNLHLKYSWWQSKYPPYRADVLGKTIPQQMLKDYNAQTYWVSVNMPQQWFSKKNWLCFSMGYSIDGFTGGKANYFDAGIVNPPAFERAGEFYLSLDIDFSKFDIRKKWLRQALKIFNVIKVPCPAFGVSTGGKFLFRPVGF